MLYLCAAPKKNFADKGHVAYVSHCCAEVFLYDFMFTRTCYLLYVRNRQLIWSYISRSFFARAQTYSYSERMD